MAFFLLFFAKKLKIVRYAVNQTPAQAANTPTTTELPT